MFFRNLPFQICNSPKELGNAGRLDLKYTAIVEKHRFNYYRTMPFLESEI